MAKPKFKPLLYTTTMRNPERLKFILYILAKFRGQILNDELATKIVGETIRYGLYRPMKQCDTIKSKWASTPNGTFSDYILTDEEVKYMLTMNPQQHKEAGFAKGFPSRFATIYDFTKEMGLAYFAPQRSIIISELGEHLLKSFNLNVKDNEILYELINPEYEQQVFLQAMARSQRKNPFVRVLNDNIPLILLLQTIKLLNADPKQNGAGISRRELPLLIFWKDNNAKSLYDRIVQLRGDCGYNPSDLSSGGTSKDSVLKLIAAPTRLEFLTALAIKSKIPNVRVLPNYSCDDEGLPTSTAGGNKGDIECFEQQKGILVEVTMATGRQQTVMEIWPIERHLTDFQKDKKAQCVFIAPSIFDDSKRQIKFVRMDSKGEKEIRPYAISEFVNFLENSKCLYVNHSYGIDYSTSSLAAEPPAPYGN